MFIELYKHEGVFSMIEKISIKITNQIVERKLISEYMREWYIYAFLRIFEVSISILTMVVIGGVTNNLIPMILFWIFFDLLRRRAGGFHCKKFWQCYFFTTVTFIGVVMIEPFLSKHFIIQILLLTVASLDVMIVGTVNHPSMNYDTKEIKKSKELSRRILIIELWIIFSLFLIGVKETYLTYMSLGVILCAVLMSLAKILKQEVSINEKT